jgi:hypothetical protein
MKDISLSCCFCDQIIESNKTDPSELIVLTNMDKSREKQHSQGFFCHLSCFQKTLSKKVPLCLYDLVDSD